MVDRREITHVPTVLPAQKRARHVGASEHGSSSATAGASEHGRHLGKPARLPLQAVEPPAIPVSPLTDEYENFPDATVDWNEEEHAEEENQVEEIWMASQMLGMVSQVLPAFADTGDNKKASSTESNVMPNDFAARILDCEVVIPDVLEVMTRAVNNLLVCRPPDTTGATEHGRPALKMKEPHVIHARWGELFNMRRCVEKDDLKAIPDEKVRANIHNMWMRKWLRENLDEQQRRKTKSEQTSIFSVVAEPVRKQTLCHGDHRDGLELGDSFW